MSWFERLTGFPETDWASTRSRFELDGERLRSLANGREYRVGRLEIPSLSELRTQVAQLDAGLTQGEAVLSNVSGDVRRMHAEPALRGALFQVASQFNLLEMIHPSVTPEHGVSGYEGDATQGPACAVAAGAATIYRNYFVPVQGVPGQTAERQIDTLADLGAELGNDGGRLWTMRNGYALGTPAGLAEISNRLDTAAEPERDRLRGLLRIGLHSDVEVTVGAGVEPGELPQIVSQAFCSALPVAYSDVPAACWRSFACLVLEAAYEATLLAAILNAASGRSRIVLLTMLGGGAFGNDREWILAALRRALEHVRSHALDVRLVSYGPVPQALRGLEREFGSTGARFVH